MLITAEMCIPLPRSLVYITYRDKLVELVPYLPNVRSVEVKSRREENERVDCVNLWHGGGRIPLAVRTVLGEAMLSWTEYATWDESNFTLEWRIETHAFTKAVFCAGKNCFLDNNGTTIIETKGELRIDPDKIEGLPQPLTYFSRGHCSRATFENHDSISQNLGILTKICEKKLPKKNEYQEL